jgi:cell wall-associated NlpC family hydrolase
MMKLSPILPVFAACLIGSAVFSQVEQKPTTNPKPPAAPAPEAKPNAPSAPATSTTPETPLPITGTTPPKQPEKKPAAVSTMLPEEIAGFESYDPKLQELIRESLALTTKNLRYQFGSSDPKAGGMDCSGTMFRVLTDAGLNDVPRQSDEFCRWVMRRTVLYRTEKATSLKDPTFSALKPGDLLFWTGTYDISSARELPISHVMLYLGKRKKDGKPVVFGASDGRTYDNERRNGVSVFDFSLPKKGSKSQFYGYGPVPGFEKSEKPS